MEQWAERLESEAGMGTREEECAVEAGGCDISSAFVAETGKI